MKRIIFCTLRDNLGATGGPGGVLYLQKKVLGNNINGIPCEYQFNLINQKLGPLKIWINKKLFYFKYRNIKDAYFFTHDIETGHLLAQLGKKYSLLYHHQGPIIQELTNLGVKLNEKNKKKISQHEQIALSKANSLHFPSNGAAEMYFNSPYASCKKKDVKLGNPLYNIIPQVKIDLSIEKKISLKKDDNILTFFSLGTLTLAKGQDQTINFLKSFLKVYHTKPLRYILVGKGPLKEQLLTELDKIKKENTHFSYNYFEAVPHDIVMYLHYISDVYIMLHRISIFDFATLEAMSQNSAIILSKIGGNQDFNKEGNIIFSEDVSNNMAEFANIDIDLYKQKNMKVFKEYFSQKAFIKQYHELFKY